MVLIGLSHTSSIISLQFLLPESSCTHTHKHRTTDRTINLLISSNVHYVHLGGDNNNFDASQYMCSDKQRAYRQFRRPQPVPRAVSAWTCTRRNEWRLPCSGTEPSFQVRQNQEQRTIPARHIHVNRQNNIRLGYFCRPFITGYLDLLRKW